MADVNQDNNAEVQQAVSKALEEQKKKKRKKWIIIAIVAVVFIILISLISSGGDDDKSAPSNSGNSTISASGETGDNNDGKIGDYICTIKSAKKVSNWEGKNAVKITYSFTNNSSDSKSFDFALSDKIFQGGIGLEESFISSDDDFLVDVEIQPGASKDVSKVYVLRDTTTPLDVEIEELISFNSSKLKYTVNLEQ